MINNALNINIVGEAGKGDKVIAKAGDIQQDIGWVGIFATGRGLLRNIIFISIYAKFSKKQSHSAYI